MIRTSKKNALSFLLAAVVSAVCLAACSTPGTSDQTDTASSDFAWSFDAGCGECHTAQEGSMGSPACLASTHKASGATCMTCHADEASLVSVHESATADGAAKATKLKKSSVDDQSCLSCHASYEKLASDSQQTAILRDSEGKEVNAHDLPETSSHGKITCTDCHSVHDENIPANDSAQKLCLSCHHEDVYECGTCHE